MRNGLYLIISLIFHLAVSASPPADFQVNTCILNFLPEEDALSRVFDQAKQDQEHIVLLNLAKPKNFLDCLEKNPEEIIWMAHAMNFPDGHVTWGYISRNPENPNTYLAPKAISPHIFKLAAQYLEEQQSRGEMVRLKKIRIISCQAREIYARYTDFQNFVDQFKVKVEIAPKTNLKSWIIGKDVTVPDPVWIKESFQNIAEGESFYAYMKLKTIGLYKYGTTEALRGKYRVKLKGLAAGLAVKWSKIQINFNHIKDLSIGDKRKFWISHLTLAMGLGLNGEVGFSPAPTLQLNSEVNSLGFSLGFASRIEIERLY